jgi:hypothetical protein
MPRMTNTYMLAGDKDPNEILASVEKGIYAGASAPAARKAKACRSGSANRRS